MKKLFLIFNALSILVFCFNQSDVFGVAVEDDYLVQKSRKQLAIEKTEDSEQGPINHMTKDIMGLLLKETSKVENPRCLISVCKHWRRALDLNDIPHAELHYSTMSLCMRQCMETFWESQFYSGILEYTPPNGDQAVTLKFSDLQDGTFDISACGKIANDLVITTDMDRFFKVGEENKDKAVILIALRHLVEKGINSQDHPFESLMSSWDADKAPVGIFWRWGNDNNLTWLDYLTTASLSKISSRNLHENRVDAASQGGGKEYLRCEDVALFTSVFKMRGGECF